MATPKTAQNKSIFLKITKNGKGIATFLSASYILLTVVFLIWAFSASISYVKYKNYSAELNEKLTEKNDSLVKMKNYIVEISAQMNYLNSEVQNLSATNIYLKGELNQSNNKNDLLIDNFKKDLKSIQNQVYSLNNQITTIESNLTQKPKKSKNN
jgi:peptidoglycan hydrolase CwlO-like protein